MLHRRARSRGMVRPACGSAILLRPDAGALSTQGSAGGQPWYGARMDRAILFAVQFLGAGVAAISLFVVMHEEMGIPRHLIIVDALAVAGVLILVRAAWASRRRK